MDKIEKCPNCGYVAVEGDFIAYEGCPACKVKYEKFSKDTTGWKVKGGN
jgi:hypothetical protein